MAVIFLPAAGLAMVSGRSSWLKPCDMCAPGSGWSSLVRRTTKPLARRWKRSSRTQDLRRQVELRLGFRPRDEIAALANGALACAYLPIDEDSVGYVTMEAFAAAKAVVTVRDAGGLLEIVHDEETGLVLDPEPKVIAAAFDRLAGDRRLAMAMGRNAKELLDSKGITWEKTIARLLG